MPRTEIIKTELAKLVIAFPQAGYNDIELDVLADMWAEDMEGMSDNEFMARVKEYRKKSRFFPTSNDILSVDLSTANPSEHKALPKIPKQLSEREVEKNKQEVGKILDMLKHKKAI